ncbi:MAG: hypothetical protein HQM03_04115 [Magnetococcales bacterium]|nr:hypothetical protein [Magnetococcales bacterium]
MSRTALKTDFQVVPYSYSSLCHVIATHIQQPIKDIADKSQLKAIHRALCALRPPKIKGKFPVHPITMIIEMEYVDRSHLQDYAEFEVYSFQGYERYCLRIHIVLDAYPAGAVARTLTGEQHLKEFTAQLKMDYAASLVIRKQPRTFLAKVVMRFPWQHLKNAFNLSLLRSYQVGLFGLSMEVHDSIAWAEQDRVVSACAASALTVQFHAMGLDRYNPRYPSPAQITQAAHTGTPTAKPIFPNDGLTTTMMSMAIRDLGLEPYHRRLFPQSTPDSTKPPKTIRLEAHRAINQVMRIVHAYARQKVTAPILGVALFEKTDDKTPQNHRAYRYQALHAVTLFGGEEWQPESKSHDWATDYDMVAQSGTSDTIRSVADSLNYLIGHDDQAGPFTLCARHKTTETVHTDLPDQKKHTLTRIMEYLDHTNPNNYSDKIINNDSLPERFRLPNHVLLAMDHQIRVHLTSVEDLAWHFTNDLHLLFKRARITLQEKYKTILYFFCPWPEDHEPDEKYLTQNESNHFPGYLWDIKLYHVNSLKDELRKQFHQTNQLPADNSASRFLVRSLPLYLWRATAWSGGHRIMDILIDATDARPCNMVLQVMVYWHKLHKYAMQVFPGDIQSSPHTPFLKDHAILTRWREQIVDQAPTQAPTFNDWYGGSYYPSMIKPHEKKCYYPDGIEDSCGTYEGTQQLLVSQSEVYKNIENDILKPKILIITPREYSKLHLEKTWKRIETLRWQWNEDTSYIWLIDHEGTLVIGQEWPVQNSTKKLGHPNLTGGGPARIAGELKWFANPEKFVINNKSGRYTKRISGRLEAHLKHAAELFKIIFNIITEYEFAPEYGEGEINSLQDLERELGYTCASERHDQEELYCKELKAAGRNLGMSLFWSWEILTATEQDTSFLSAQSCWTTATRMHTNNCKQQHLMIWSLSTWWKHIAEQTPNAKKSIEDFDRTELITLLVATTEPGTSPQGEAEARMIKAAAALALARLAKLRDDTKDTLISHIRTFMIDMLRYSHNQLSLTRAEWEEIHEVILLP